MANFQGSEGAKLTKADKAVELGLAIFFIILCVVYMVPLLNVVATSLSSKSAILAGKVGILPVDFTLEAYKSVASNSTFISSFSYSIFLTAGYTFLAMAATTIAAYPLSRNKLKGRIFISSMIVFTMYFSAGMIPSYLNIKNLGLMGSPWVLVIPGLISAYNLIIVRTFFRGIDNSLYEAAYLDGCSEFQTLYKIVLPLSGPVIATISLFYAVSRWNTTQDQIFYIDNPDYYTVQLQLKRMMDAVAVANSGDEDADIALASLTAENIKAASIVVAMLPMLIAYPFVQRHFTKGIMLGSVKG